MAAEEGICVAIRMRPLNGRERIQGQNALWRCLPAYNSITQINSDGTPLPERHAGSTFFTFDKVFGDTSNTQEVYEAVGRPIVQSVLQGFNGTIFAYGQTSSGKTHTMVGGGEAESAEEGMLHLAARDIFQLISQTSDRDFLLRVSYVEIYNENIRDLLEPDTPSLTIREDPRKGVYIEASESIITDFDSIMNALKMGSKNRRVEATAMNERSSRSHTIFRMVLESKERKAFAAMVEEGGEEGAAVADADVDGAVLVATLNLVDLAGSESVRHTGATGNRAKEGGKINQSLLTLSRVIHALGQEGAGHIGFRDSKLTRILQPSLSGNAKMAVVCCITPAERYLEETRSTLQFASRAKMVKTRAVVNEVLDDRAQLKRLKKELQELKERQKQLESGGGVATGALSLEDVSRLEAEKELMSGKVEQLEAERHEQANKIDRLTNLILQGGELMGHAVGNDSLLRMGGGRHGRRGKRLRETWCPGESKLPPGAALRSLKELVEDDEADDRLVSNLNFGKVSKRRGGSSVASRSSEAAPRTSSASGASDESAMMSMADDGTVSMDFGAVEGQQQPSTAMHVAAPENESSHHQELEEIRAILSAHPDFAAAGEDGNDVVSMVRAMADALRKQCDEEQEATETEAGEALAAVGEVVEEKEQSSMAMADKESRMYSLQASQVEQMATLQAMVESLQQQVQTQAEEMEKRAASEGQHMARLKEALGLQAAEEEEEEQEEMSDADVVGRAIEEMERLGEKLKEAVQQSEARMQVTGEGESSDEKRSAAALDLHTMGRQAVDAAVQAEMDLLLELVQATATTTSEELARLKQQVRELQEANDGLVTARQNAEEELSQQAESFEGQMADVRQSMEAVTNERSNLVAEVERLTGEELARLEQQVRELQEANDGLVAARQTAEEALGQQAESFEEQAVVLRQSMEEVSNECNNLVAEVERLTGELQAARDQAAAEVADLQEQLTAQEEATANAQAAKHVVEMELREQIAGLQAAVEEATTKQEEQAAATSDTEAEEDKEAAYQRGLREGQVQVDSAIKQLMEVSTLQLAITEQPASLEAVVQHIGQVAYDRAMEVAQLQGSVLALSEQLQQLEKQTEVEDEEEHQQQERRASRAAVVRHSVGGVATGPPQPLLDELRLKLGSATMGEAEDEDEAEVVEQQQQMEEEQEKESAMEETEASGEVDVPAEATSNELVTGPTEEEQGELVPLNDEDTVPGAFTDMDLATATVEEQDLKARVAELEEAIAQLTQDSTGLQEEVARLQAALTAAESEAEESRSLVTDKTEEVVRLSEQLEEAISSSEGTISAEEAARLSAEVEQLGTEVEEAAALAKSKEEEAEALRVKLETTVNELGVASNEVQGLQERLVSEGEVSEKLVQDLEEEIATSRAEVDTLMRRIAELEQLQPKEQQPMEVEEESSEDGGDRNNEAAEADDRLQALTTELSTLSEQLAQKDADVARERQRVEELEAQLAAAAEVTAAINNGDESNEDNSHSDATAFNNAAAALVETEDGSVEARAQRLQSLLLNEQNARQEAENGLSALHNELSEARTQLRRAEEEFEERARAQEAVHIQAKRELERQVAEMGMQEGDVKQLRDQIEALTAELNSTREELSQSRSEAVGSASDDTCLRKRVSQLQTQLDLAEGKAAKHEARVKELETEINKVVRAAEDEQEQARRHLEQAERAAAQQDSREADVAALRESCNAMLNKLTTLKAERDEVEERATRAADAVESLEKELEGLRGQSSDSAAAEVEALQAELEQARTEAADRSADASQLQVRLRRVQQEVEALRSECESAREEAEQARQASQEGAKAMAEVEELRAEQSSSEEQMRCLQRALEVMEAHLEAERVEVQGLNGQVERLTGLLDKETKAVVDLQTRLDAAEAEAEAQQQATKTAEAAKAELLKEMNALFLAECDAKLQIEQKDQEVNDLKQALVEAKNKSSSSQQETEELVEDLRAQLASREREYNIVHGDNYRMKRELSELREAAEAAEVAIGAHTEEMDKVQRALKNKTQEVARLERVVDDMTRDMQAKDERIKKLDKAKLTTDQVEKLQKLKKEWAQFQNENEQLKQELQSVQQTLHDMSMSKGSGGADGEVAEALEAQSSTITELMAVRETLTAKLRTAQANCRKLEIERGSVLEMLQELPAESIRFDQVPEDLSVAVGMLIEKYLTEVAEGRKESTQSHSDRSVLLNEVKTLTDEKETLKRKVQALEQSLTMSEIREEELKGQTESGADKAAGTEAKLRQLQATHTAAQEEATRSIRFLEKENLELMMEIKDLKTRIIKLQTEVDTLRSGLGASSSSTTMTPSTGRLARADVNVTTGVLDTSSTTKRLSSSAASIGKATSSKSTAGSSSFVAAMHDKENSLSATAGAFRGVGHDDTAPPFRSMVDEDDDGSASAQCRQS